MTDHPYTNRLIREKSPYLQQHAHNPVDWYPWGEEAFEVARSSDKPIFLSIGYATCHWCHVMERDVFDDVEIAKLMNEAFINIKVDREELPNVDALYMEMAQAMLGGSAGWPLNLMLTPDLQPFYAATYLPAVSKQGFIGMRDMIQRMTQIWTTPERALVLAQANEVVEEISRSVQAVGRNLPNESDLHNAAELFFKIADPIYGGIQGAPKFPIGYQNTFLLRYYRVAKDSRALFCVEKTLGAMQRGGIHDQLDGGFSRYCIDERWVIPHFEKMLYDNALLADAYLETWQATKNPLYREVCEGILNYVLGEMTDSQGGFYSAEDADTEGEEGRFYTWTPSEVVDVLGQEESFLFCDHYGISPDGHVNGRSVLNQRMPTEEFAPIRGLDTDQLKRKLEEQRAALLKERNKRPRPFKDEKILTCWNGLMIHSMASAGVAFDDPRYLEAALKAAKFLQQEVWDEGKLKRRWKDGEARFEAALEDYAYLIRGVLTLFEATGDVNWLEWAQAMAGTLEAHYKVEGGAFHQSSEEAEHLLVRKVNFVDGAEPTGNAVHAENLVRLFQLSMNKHFEDQFTDLMKAFYENFVPGSVGYAYFFLALQYYLDAQAVSIVIALNKENEHKEVLQQAIFCAFIPHKIVIWRQPDDEALFGLLEQTRDQAPVDGKTTLYICQKGECKAPVSGLSDMLKAIHEL